MALIPLQHNIAANYPVDPDWVAGTDDNIEAGRLVTIGTDGFVTLSTTTARAFGLAGDNLSNASGGTAYAADLVIGASNSTRSTENRVSDMYNETLASGQMTVYSGGGVFLTDQVGAAGVVVGSPVYSNATGQFSSVAAGSNWIVGLCSEDESAYPSGVPGVDVQGSISLGTFIRVQLTI